jgi:hypothetical protein
VQHRGDLVELDNTPHWLISGRDRLHVAYEAGHCGSVIWRHLSTQSIDCGCLCETSRRPQHCASQPDSQAGGTVPENFGSVLIGANHGAPAIRPRQKGTFFQ